MAELTMGAGVAAAPELIECFEPATRRRLGAVRVDPPEAVRRAIAEARAAQPALAATSFAARRELLARLLTHVLENADELCELVVRDTGKTRENAMVGEIWPVCEKLRWTIAEGERHLAPERVSSGLLVHKRARIVYEPRGVLGAILPWNYPLQNVMNPVIPALMAGNAVVVKASEWVAWSSARLQRIFDEALAAAGLPRALVRIVNGYAATGEALVRGGVDALVFIGSVANGRRVLQAAAEGLVPVVLELGGKDPFIVCDDADLEQAAQAAVNGCFINAGQNCVAAERLLVFDGIYDRFLARVTALAGALRQGPPLGAAPVDVGAMVTPLQLLVVERLVADAVARGAQVVVGGQRALGETGDYFAPTVIVNVRPEMALMQEETFGPVMQICRVSGEDEAVRIANATPFGLSSTVMSRDPARARRIAARLRAGMCGINEYGGATYMVPALPFGGVGHSGFGRLNGREGLRACTNPKAVLDDRLPLHVPNKLFPVAPGDYARTRELLRLLYGRGLGARLAGLKRLLFGPRE
jgi:acyl-CoA reductase-like NAD-dependent aldehyde dehydrogenase